MQTTKKYWLFYAKVCFYCQLLAALSERDLKSKGNNFQSPSRAVITALVQGKDIKPEIKKKLPSNFFYNRLGIFSEILPPYKEVLIDEILRLINNNLETNKLKQPDLILLQVLSLTKL